MKNSFKPEDDNNKERVNGNEPGVGKLFFFFIQFDGQ